MGIAFVLIFWAIAGTILAGGVAVILASATALLTRGVVRRRRALVLAAALLPFGCLPWAGVVFVFQAAVNEGLLHRDIGAGDSWHASLVNGYQVLFIDITDQATIYNPKTQRFANSVTDGPDTIFGARTLQVAGPYLLGGMDKDYFKHPAGENGAVNSYFFLDTRTGQKSQEADLGALTDEAARHSIALHLEPIYRVYCRYRFTWFDVFAGCLLVLPPLAAFATLGYFVVRLRRSPVAAVGA